MAWHVTHITLSGRLGGVLPGKWERGAGPGFARVCTPALRGKGLPLKVIGDVRHLPETAGMVSRLLEL
jgi:hypothetical protein